MQIYIHQNGQQLGPFSEEEIKAKLAAGTVSLQDSAWWQGLPNWMPLGQSPLVATLSPGSTPLPAPLPGIPSAPYAGVVAAPTSQFAIWSLVCGCLGLACAIFTSIPAIVLGHMSLAEIKKNPALQGRGMAIAGLVLGYVMSSIWLLYIISIIAISVLIALGNNVKETFKTIDSQISASQSQDSQGKNDPDQSTNSSDQNNSTNSAPATTTP